MIKKFMYINRRAPHGTNYAHEGLEVALIGAAFDQEVSVAYIDDGVFQLRSGQDTGEVGLKNFTNTFGALGDYDITRVYVDRDALAERGMTEEDLMPLVYEDEDDDWAEKPLLTVVDRDRLATLIAEQDVILNF